jgi:hypothetical protein
VRSFTALLCSVQLLFLGAGIAFAGIDFRDKNSKIVLSNGTFLQVEKDNFAVDGTLEVKSGGTVAGGTILFNDSGSLIENGLRTELAGKLNLTASGIDTLSLSGSDTLSSVKNVSTPLIVSGIGNLIEGQPTFSGSITLQNSSTQLNMAIQSKLNKDITLGGGRIILQEDLNLADNISFLTTGSVKLNGHTCNFGAVYTNKVTGTIAWLDGADISLSGNLPITGQWQFVDNTLINGNGNQIDFSGLGSFSILNGIELTLNNVRLKGVENNSITFGNQSSKLILSDVLLDFSSSATVGHGNVNVISQSTAVFGDNSWSFTGNGKLTVDGTSLWIDPLSNSPFPPLGQIYAPGAIYSGYPNYAQNVPTNITAGNFSLVNSGTVKLLQDSFVAYNSFAARAISPLVKAILSEAVTGSHTLDQSVQLSVSEVVRITDDATIDGDGESLVFTPSSSSQLKIDDYKKLTLKNIRLSNVTANTFEIGRGAKLDIDDGVIIELAEDVTFDEGTIKLISTPNNFYVRGVGGKKVMFLSSKVSRVPFSLDLQGNSLVLENVELRGIDYIDYSTQTVSAQSYTGSIVLAGNSTAYVDGLSSMNFLVSDLGNTMLIDTKHAYLKGSMRFDDFATESEIRFTFASSAGAKLEDRILEFWPSFLEASSENGTARLLFDDNIQVINKGSTSFVLGRGASLDGLSLLINTNPIFQTSTYVSVGRNLILDSDQTDAIKLDDAIKSLEFLEDDGRRSRDIWFTPFDELQEYRSIERMVAKAKRFNQISDENTEVELKRENDNRMVARGELGVPAGTIIYRGKLQVGALAGKINLEEPAKITKFGVHASDTLTLALTGDVEIEQGPSDITLKAADSITIRGKNNKFKVSKGVTFAADLTLEANSSLDFEFDDLQTAPYVSFSSLANISIGAGAQLNFSGNGTVIMENSSKMTLATKSKINVANSAVFTVDPSATSIIDGTGDFVCKDGGKILLDSDSTLALGNAKDDQVDLTCKRGGGIDVEIAGSGSGNARLCLGKGKHNLSVVESGYFRVGNKGIAEFAQSNGSPSEGSLDSFKTGSNGFFLVDDGGKAEFTTNQNSETVNWDSRGGWVRGKGKISFKDRATNSTLFEGKLSATKDEIYFNNSAMDVKALAEKMIQKDATLQQVTRFDDESGNEVVLTKENAKVSLGANESFVREEADGGIVTFDSGEFTQKRYGPSGARRQ